MSTPRTLILCIFLLACSCLSPSAKGQTLADLSLSRSPFLGIPAYPQASGPSQGGQAAMFELYETTASPHDVLAFYQTALPEWGWLLEATSDLGRQKYMTCSKHESRIVLKIQKRSGGSSFRFSRNEY